MRRFLPVLALAVLTGCGYMGDPLPPLANVPQRARDVRAFQRGSNIVIEFPVPQLTTENIEIPKPVRLEVRIGPGSPSGPDEWASKARRVEGGEVSSGVARYETPSSEWIGQDVSAGVQVTGGNGKSSGWSELASVMVVPAPQTPAGLTAVAAPQGVQLRWTAAGQSFRVLRKAAPDTEYRQVATVTAPEWLDTETEFGKKYEYEIRTVAPLPNGGEAVSELSQPAGVTPEDIFPPATPGGLEASAAPASVELTWNANTDTNLGGYRVYRSANGGEFAKIADSLQTPAYSDTQAEHGKTYRYQISAVSKTSHESSRSAAFEIAFP
jgi:hypothetical protein